VLSRASTEAAHTAENARASADELLAKAGVEARDISDTARRQAEQLLATASVGVAEPDAQHEQQPEAAEPEEQEPPVAAEPGASAPESEIEEDSASPAGGFTPPPTSLEDLAAASRPKRFSFRNQ